MVRRKKPHGPAAIDSQQKKRNRRAAHRSTVRSQERFEDFDLPERRLIERTLRGISGRRGAPDQEAARDWLDRACEARNADEARKCALQALSYWPDCADAFCVLAELSRDSREAAALYQEGMAAGQRAVGGEFENLRGHFWGMLDTRPYMRAREGLALALHALGRSREAADHLQEMLTLNPNDNQGARHTLMPWLLELDAREELDALLTRYAEDYFAITAWTRVLASLRNGDDPARTKDLLDEALKRNPHVVDFLLGAEQMRDDVGEYVTLGEESEAAHYAESCLRHWRATRGAITWLRKATGTPVAESRLRGSGN
jgi:tetratricopeptide (TPR) repeat protein